MHTAVIIVITYDPISKSGVVVLTTGTPSYRDKADIYKVCGEICSYFYQNVLE